MRLLRHTPPAPCALGLLDGDVIAVSGQNAASDGPVDHDILDDAYRTAIDRAS